MVIDIDDIRYHKKGEWGKISICYIIIFFHLTQSDCDSPFLHNNNIT